jgi:hypothetical protein
VYGPSVPIEGIISRGSRTTFIQKIPNGGIHAVRRMCSSVIVDLETYSTAALQKIVSSKLIKGATIQPRSAKRMCDREGMYRHIPRLLRVRITPWIILKVIRIA